MTLIPTSLQRVGNYDLAGEDPAMYDSNGPFYSKGMERCPSAI